MTDIKRFLKNKKYIGICYKHKDCFGFWQDDISIHLISGKPRNKSDYDNIVDYTLTAWEVVSRLIKEQAEKYNRNIIIRNGFIGQSTKWE